MKRTVSALISLAIVVGALALPISAANEYPSAFWKLNDRYNAAFAENDYQTIADCALEICALFEGREETPIDIRNSILSSRYYEAGNALERLGKYELAAECFTKSIPYNEALGFSDAVRIAESKAKVYTSSLELYRSYYSYQSFFGAKNEKESGVLFGTNLDSTVYDQITERSMALIYQNFGDTELAYTKRLLKESAEKGMAIQYALNLPREGAQLAEVLASEAYILDIIEMLDGLETPIYLRFACEMDTWSTPATPEAYIEMFRYVSGLVKANSENIAMVWSPTFATGFDVNVHDFYPGDEYVDWIGLSLYMIKYHMGNNALDEANRLITEASFFAGNAANPVIILEDFIETYGDRKPFMISESGASHNFRFLGIDETLWAYNRMKQLYSYVPMVYPQVKLIAHFDKVMPAEYCDFSLCENPALTSLYSTLTRGDAFVRGGFDGEANCSYIKLGDTFWVEQGYNEFSTYAYYYGKENLTVNYYIDGNLIGSSSELPYRVGCDLSGIEVGDHMFMIEAIDENGVALGFKSYTLSLSKTADVNLNGEMLPLAQKPIIENGTTLVPLRAIFEKLGGTVEWDGSTRSIFITRGDVKLKLAIGSYNMDKNGQTIRLSVPARLINATTYIPLRAIIDALGGEIGWDGANKLISIKTAD